MSWIVSTGLKKDVECAELNNVDTLKEFWGTYKKPFGSSFEMIDFYRKFGKFSLKNVVIKLPSFDFLINNQRQKVYVKHYYIYNLLNFFGIQRFISESNTSFNFKQIYFYKKDNILRSLSFGFFNGSFRNNFENLFKFNFINKNFFIYNLNFFEKYILYQSITFLKLKLFFCNNFLKILNLPIKTKDFKNFIFFSNFENFFEFKLKFYFTNYFKKIFKNFYFFYKNNLILKNNLFLNIFIIFRFLFKIFKNMKLFLYKWSSLGFLFYLIIKKKLALKIHNINLKKFNYLKKLKEKEGREVDLKIKKKLLNKGIIFFLKKQKKTKIFRFLSYYYDFFINVHLESFQRFFKKNLCDFKLMKTFIFDPFEDLKKILINDLQKFKFIYFNDYYQYFFKTLDFFKKTYADIINLNFIKKIFVNENFDFLFNFVTNYVFLMKERQTEEFFICKSFNINNFYSLMNYSEFFLGKWFYYRYLTRFIDNNFDYDYARNNNFLFLLASEDEIKKNLLFVKKKSNLMLNKFYKDSVLSHNLKQNLYNNYLFNKKSSKFLKNVKFFKNLKKFLNRNFSKNHKNLFKFFKMKIKKIDFRLKRDLFKKNLCFKLFEFKKQIFYNSLLKYNNNFFFNIYGKSKVKMLYSLFFNNTSCKNFKFKNEHKYQTFLKEKSIMNLSKLVFYKNMKNKDVFRKHFLRKIRRYFFNSYSITNDSIDRKTIINSFFLLYKNIGKKFFIQKKKSFIFYK